MARPKFSSPDQPSWVRWPLRACDALASLELAVLVISSLALLLAWATWLDATYGPKAAQFAIYGTWWFSAVLALLGINVLFAALIRFPWKRHQTGFVITHLGILALLAGCFLTRLGGIDAQMPIPEDSASHRAFEDRQHFELTVSETAESRPQRIYVPFVSGPLSWAEYDQRFIFPWGLTHIDRGLLYDRDGIRLEVLDYFTDAELIPASPLELRANSAAASSKDIGESSRTWQDIKLSASSASRGATDEEEGNRAALPGDVQVLYWSAKTQEETEAFLDSQPDGPVGKKGQLILHVGGKKHVFQVDDLKPRQRFPVGDSGITMELVEHNPQISAVQLLLYPPDGTPQRMVVAAKFPDWSDADAGRGILFNHARDYGVYGAYWAPPEAVANAAAEAGKDAKEKGKELNRPDLGRRIDLLQGTDGRLYYRIWNAPHVEAIGPMPLDDSPVTAFAKEPYRTVLVVDKFDPDDMPGARLRMVPHEFQQREKSSGGEAGQRRVRVRLTVDGRSEVFWLDGIEKYPVDLPPGPSQARAVAGQGRRVQVALKWDAFDLGFDTFLHEFSRKLDPGTSMASHYSSLVEFRDRDTQEKLVPDKVLVTLNEPVDFVDPRVRRTYRIFQESFAGPFKPGDRMFDQRVASTSHRDQLFTSTLTINYDPGRGLKYLGSLLMVAGVITMFYMRAYFFKRRGKA